MTRCVILRGSLIGGDLQCCVDFRKKPGTFQFPNRRAAAAAGASTRCCHLVDRGETPIAHQAPNRGPGLHGGADPESLCTRQVCTQWETRSPQCRKDYVNTQSAP